MSGTEYTQLPNEPIWDHANRLMISHFVHYVAESAIARPDLPKLLSHHIAAYVNSFDHSKNTLLALYRTRELMHESFRWTQDSHGNWMSPLLTPDAPAAEWVKQSSRLFVEFVKSWQPVMDAIAVLVSFLLEVKGINIRANRGSMYELQKCVQSGTFPTNLCALRQALTSRVEWYTNEIRVKRNQFVHNERVAILLPAPGSEETLVSVKKLDRDQTEERFPLDVFLNWTLGKYFLFAIAMGDAAKQVCSA
ncbi:MAG: hypothetical protein NT166_24315 [Candidatus Aminicenantes bacterium]|nr:hypothetical protein [Candidatus Aminicenantes bacterium]